MKKETIIPIIILILIISLFFGILYPHSLRLVLFPFKVNGNSDNECFVSYSVRLTNLTKDPIYEIGNKCCSITNQQEYPKYTFTCVDMNKSLGG